MREGLYHILGSQFVVATCERDVGITLDSTVKGSPLHPAVLKSQIRGIHQESKVTVRLLE